ncbi:MAG TPA: adenylate/guanylate cyclase domain-containing protein [Ktedonobacterales bacterium]|nr:adenylate/guanylate cyclase domain-containing protein [Ktedonobacterales bacterium]
MNCPNCGAENPPSARFCVSCGQPLPRICPNCGASNPSGARFCNQCGFNLEAASPAAPAAAAEPARPVASTAPLAQHAAHGEEAEEESEQRRIVTVLFADLTSSTTLGESLDAEEMRALLARFFAAMTSVIHRHGGSVEKYIGDAIMAVFGLPVAHEDDPARAVRAALEMQARLRELNAERLLPDGSSAPELEMRIGVNTGEVAAAGAAREGQDFLITGDPVNVAARLQQLAQPGSVLVGPRAYRATRGVIKYRALSPAPLRGKARPVSIWEATGRLDNGVPAPRPRGLDGAISPLVGRDVEMALLDAVFTRVMRERNPHLITILGAPGVGKTRLAREFIRRAVGASATRELTTVAQAAGRADLTAQADHIPSGPLPLEGRCPPYGEDITYWPLTEMLRVYAGFTTQDPPERARAKLLAGVRARLSAAKRSEDPEFITAYLAYTIGIETHERCSVLLPTDARQLQEGVHRAWRVFFETLAAGRGVIALIDDAHWADDALLDLLASVAGQASGEPLLFILTARPELTERRPNWGGGRRNYVTLGLEPLSPIDTRRLLDELLPGPGVPDSLRQGILDKADGNPFYVEEIVRMLIDREALARDEAGWRLASGWEGAGETLDPVIPDTVQGVLAARLDLLPPSERDVLRHASVIGRYFWPSALLSLAPHLQPAALIETIASLREKDLIRVTERSAIGFAPPGEEVYTFHHALIREVVYSSIPRTRRAHEHLRVAEWLESLTPTQPGGFAELLGQHYYRYYTLANLARSRNVERRRETRAKVIAALRLAGERAVTLHALTKADTYFSDALDLLASDDDPNDIPTAVSLLIARASARWLAMRADDAWDDYREALRAWASLSSALSSGVSATPVSIPAATGASNGSNASSGRFATPASLAEGDCAVSALPPDWRQTGMRLYCTLAQLPARSSGLFRQPPPHEELLAYLEEGLRLADELGQRDTLDYAQLLTAKAFFWWSWAERRGERELLDAYRSAREAVRITENVGDARAASEALDALGNLQAIMSDLTGYLESQQRRLRLAESIEDRQELVDINTEVSQACQLIGDFAESVRYASAANTLATEASSDELCVKALWRLTLAWSDWDRWPEALQAGAELDERAQRTVMRRSEHHRWALLSLATIHTRMGDADAATRLVRAAAESSEPAERVPQYVELARARLALARGATREARQILLAALDLRSGRYSMVAVMAELAEIAARVGDGDLYERFGPGALELGWRSGARKALAQAIRARAIVAISAGRWDDALSDVQSAIRRYVELGCGWEEARSRYALAGLYRRRNDTHDADLARDELTRALAIFERLQSVRDIARARAALAGGDIRLP